MVDIVFKARSLFFLCSLLFFLSAVALPVNFIFLDKRVN